MWIEITTKPHLKDVRKIALQHSIKEDLGVDAEVTKTADIYYIRGNFSDEQMQLIGRTITDAIAQSFSCNPVQKEDGWIIIVKYKPRITDPVEQSVLKAISDVGLQTEAATMMQKYVLKAQKQDAERICKELLANENAHDYYIGNKAIDIK